MPVSKEYVGVKFRQHAQVLRWGKDGGGRLSKKSERPTDDEGRFLDLENPTFVSFEADDAFDVEHHLTKTHAIELVGEPKKSGKAESPSPPPSSAAPVEGGG